MSCLHTDQSSAYLFVCDCKLMLVGLQAWRAVDRAYYDKNFNGQSWFKVSNSLAALHLPRAWLMNHCGQVSTCQDAAMLIVLHCAARCAKDS